MTRSTRTTCVTRWPVPAAAALLICLAAPGRWARADVGPDAAEKLYERVSPSLVVVKYTWEGEMGRREMAGTGIVVSKDGLIMTSGSLFDIRTYRIPDEQLKEFKILIPSQDKDPEELDADFLGRDDRTSMGFVKAKASSSTKKGENEGGGDNDKPAAKHEWKPLKFEEHPVRIGEPILSVGLLPEAAAYKPYFMESAVAATLRGETPQVLVQGGGLGVVGSPVFNTEGKAIGIVPSQTGQNGMLNEASGSNLPAAQNPPKFFTPSRDFAQSLEDPPADGKPVPLSWLGVLQMNGLNKDVAEVYNLTNKPAVQIGEVLPDTPAEKAGLKQGDIIVKLNGEPLERGDEPIELPMILTRKILRMKPGTEVTLSVLRKKNQPLQDIKVTLAEQPAQPHQAKRFWAEDLGFATRALTFWDAYARRLPLDTKGVAVALIKPQSAAQTGHLRNGDLITQLNGQPVTDLDEFQKSYEQARKDKPKEAVVLVVRREGSEDTVRIEPPQQ
jgi:S1-C subfamily serine protease